MGRTTAGQRRELLLDAAQRVMTRAGVAGGTTRAIVAEAGMPLSTFHYCFRSRDELLAELVGRLTSAERHAVLAATTPGADVQATLARAAEAYLAHLRAEPGQEQVLLELAHHALRDPALAHLAREQYRAYYDTAAAVLRRVAQAHDVSWAIPEADLARLVITVIDGVTTTWLADRDDEATRAVLGPLLGLVAGYAVPAERGAPSTRSR